MDTFIQLTVDALTLGSVYALIALGYTLVYGVLKLLNFAHGDVFMVGSFGPPAYGAAQVAMAAIAKACAKDGGSLKSRKDVIAQVKHVVIKNWILGGTFRFSTKTNDPLNGRFTIFQIQSNGSYKVVN